MKRIDSVEIRVSPDMRSGQLADQIADALQVSFDIREMYMQFVPLDGDTMAELMTKGEPFTRQEHDQIFAVIRDVLMDWKHGVITTDGHVTQ